MYENSGSQFYRTTTGIQSGPDMFDESKFVMTFLTILENKEILCSFRLVPEGKKSKDIPELSRLELLEKFLANICALSNWRSQHFWTTESRRYSRFTFVENTISKLAKVPRAKFLGSDSCFNSICKFGSFKNPFAIITNLSELPFRFRRFILLV